MLIIVEWLMPKRSKEPDRIRENKGGQREITGGQRQSKK